MTSKLWAVTLKLPAHSRNMRETGKLLHKWRIYLQSHGNISFKGGIFLLLDEVGKLQFHVHLFVQTTICRNKMKSVWLKISELSATSEPCWVKTIDNNDNWHRYIYDKNVKEAVSYKLVSYLEQHLSI